MNKKKLFRIASVAILGVIGIYLLIFSASACKAKVFHVGILSGLEIFAKATDGFKAKMTELGYTEGKNIIYDVQKMDFDMDKYKSTLKKFVDDKVDLILVYPTEPALEAKAATKDKGIPVVFVESFTEDTGLVKSNREPGDNITGVRWDSQNIVNKRFELLHSMAPNVKRMIIIYQKDYPIVKSQLEILYPIAKKNEITLLEVPASDPKELESELKKIQVNSKTDAILAIAETLLGQAWDLVSNFANTNKIPVGSGVVSEGADSALFDFSPYDEPQGNQAAILADKILKGTPAGTIPVISADNYLVLNLKKAKELGININNELVTKADKIIR